MIYRAELERHLEVCPRCDYHMRLSARRRLQTFLDEGFQTEIGADVKPVDRLKFRDLKKYRDRLHAAQKSTGEEEAMVVMRGEVRGVHWSPRHSNMVLLVVQWAQLSVSVLCVVLKQRWKHAFRLFVFQRVVVHACKKR